MKGIILAGGSGSRLYPMTSAVNKQILPVYDKPMIYYPITTLVKLGIKDICIISSPEYKYFYHSLFGDGSKLGLNIVYRIQHEPNGIAESLIIGESFIKNSSVALILGDNIFHGLPCLKPSTKGATIFTYKVSNPQRYGVVNFDKNLNPIELEEKPQNPKSNHAITGLYFFTKDCSAKAKSLKPSERGELEITDLNNLYLQEKRLDVFRLPRGTAWLDAGTPQSLFESSMYVRSTQNRSGIKIGCLEEECFNQGLISKNNFKNILDKMPESEYKHYLSSLKS